MTMIEFTVDDMTCGHCAATITAAVKAVDPAGRCEIDLAARRIRIETAFSPERMSAAIAKAGFSPVSVSAS
jgi:copper chaperone